MCRQLKSNNFTHQTGNIISDNEDMSQIVQRNWKMLMVLWLLSSFLTVLQIQTEVDAAELVLPSCYRLSPPKPLVSQNHSAL